MVDPLPRWAKAFLGVLGVALALWLGWRVLVEPAPKPARWRVDPSAELDAATREIPIVVNESACASGASAKGRIEADVTYRSDQVHIEVKVRPRGGGQECPSNPDTPYVVELREPLGDREVTGEDWSLP